MINKLKNIFLKRENFAQGAAVLSVTTFLSYLTGLLRDRLFAHRFGASRALDLYNTAFIIPDLLFNVLVASALSAAFVPMFTSMLAQDKQQEANRLANTVLHSAILVILVSGLAAAVFMPALSRMIAPGFNEEEIKTLANLARLMMISPLIMAVSNTFGAMLVSFKRFLAYGVSPVFYNLGIIAGVYLIPWFGVRGLVLGTLAGAALHMLPRLWAIKNSPFRYALKIKLKDANFIKVIKLMLPKMIGHPVEQLTFLGFARIATLLAAGSVTAVSFARNFQSVPVSLFGIAFATAVFPSLAECAAKNDQRSFMKNFRKALRDILLFTLPCAAGLYFLSDLPIRIFLGGGRFSEENILRTAGILSVFALSIPTESLVHLLARAFYALKNTYIPVLFSIANFLISVSFAYFKSKQIGIAAIPYGFFLGSLSEVVLLAMVLRFKLKNFSPPLKASQ